MSYILVEREDLCADCANRVKPENNPEVPHGTLTGYSNWKCKCDDCKAAVKRYHRKYYRENRSKEAQDRVAESG